MSVREEIEAFIPHCEQEETDKKNILALMDTYDNLLDRSNNAAHFTSSSWIVNPGHTKVLMIYHKIYRSWSWTGGHVDGDDNFLRVALKEAKEETGVEVKPVTDSMIALDILPVWSHIKRGKFVSSHMHLNVAYLVEASEEDVLVVNQEETKGVRWIDMDKLEDYISLNDIEMLKVYHKLNQRVKEYDTIKQGGQ